MTDITKHRIIYAAADLLSVATGWFCFNMLRYNFFRDADEMWYSVCDFLLSAPVILGQIAVPVCMLILYVISGSYNRSNTLYKSRLDETLNTLTVSFTGMLGIYFTALLNNNIPERLEAYELMAVLLCCLFVPTAFVRLIILNHNAKLIKQGRYAMKTLVVDASPANEAKLARILTSRATSGLKIIACVDLNDSCPQPTLQGIPVEKTDDIESLCHRLGIQAIVVLSSGNIAYTAGLLDSLYRLDLPMFITPDLHSLILARPRLATVSGEPLVDITNAKISPASVNLKRLGDIVVSALALIMLSPLLAALAIVVKLDSPGPVFYRQTRIGYHKKPFRIIKFRSMRADAETNGPALSSANDPRVTHFGHIMRKYRLDELPQFWNVLIGQMSLVGPRPEREFFLKKILERHPASSLLHQVRPGITSWGMVSYGYASNVNQMMERLYYDLLYIENISLATNLKIILHTVDTVINGRGK